MFAWTIEILTVLQRNNSGMSVYRWKNWLKSSFPYYPFALRRTPISYMTDRHTAPLCITQRFVCVCTFIQRWANKPTDNKCAQLERENANAIYFHLFERCAAPDCTHTQRAFGTPRFCTFHARVPRADASTANLMGPCPFAMHCYCFKAVAACIYLHWSGARYLIRAQRTHGILLAMHGHRASQGVCVVLLREDDTTEQIATWKFPLIKDLGSLIDTGFFSICFEYTCSVFFWRT